MHELRVTNHQEGTVRLQVWRGSGHTAGVAVSEAARRA
jgi:hypothetical protein